MEVSHEGITGLGEAAAVDHGGSEQTAASSEKALRGLMDDLSSVAPWQVLHIEKLALRREIGSAARAALDIACWDWLAKKAGLPLYRLLGLNKEQPLTSVTVGIEAPERVGELASEKLAHTGVKVLKLKLGGEGGIEADKARYLAARDAAGPSVALRIDANGGWTTADAVRMNDWLAMQRCEYVEQPLDPGASIEDLAEVYKNRRLPVLLDEPIFGSKDVARYASVCDGVNVKLMKSGGISEAVRAVHTARAHGLSTMLGCFGESSVSISAAASLGALLDYVDLDSNLNLDPDPAVGASLVEGRLEPRECPGHGARLHEEAR